MNIASFLFTYALQILVTAPRFLASCTPLGFEAICVYLAHHALDVYIFWGPLFLQTQAEFQTYILITALVGAHWFLNNNQCIATVYMNHLCGYPEADWLDSLKNRLGLRSFSEEFHFYWIGATLLYAIYKSI
jgi:hypothetical protein